MIKTKRVYAPASAADGKRFLVDRLWPRGIKKDKLQIEEWSKEAAPSNELRKRFSHESSKWEEFCNLYFRELENNPNSWKPILEAAKEGDVTLVFAAKNEEINNAVALKKYLESKIEKV